MHRMIWAVLVAFFAAILAGPLAIRLLRRLKVGQNVYELAPEAHQKKQGTPTMGGLMFAAISILAAFALRVYAPSLRTDMVLALAAFAALNLFIGFLDDFTKLRAKKNQGLREWQKLVPQCLIAAAFTLYCMVHPEVGTKVAIPFFGVEWDMGFFYLPAMVFIILCTTNGANLLDGLDGLLASSSAVIMAFFTLTALTLSAGAAGGESANLMNVGLFCAAVGGALLGYLRFNLYPAQMMMGDTGSMYLGGLVVGAAMLMRSPFIILIAAGTYAVSLLSSFLQRMYYKATGGKRIFKNSPLHHHFEMLGVPETRIVSMYTIATVVLCLIAYLGV